MNKVFARDKQHLEELIELEIEIQLDKVSDDKVYTELPENRLLNLTHIDVSAVTDMSEIFANLFIQTEKNDADDNNLFEIAIDVDN